MAVVDLPGTTPATRSQNPAPVGSKDRMCVPVHHHQLLTNYSISTPLPSGAKAAHNGVLFIGERGNSLLKTTFKALRNVSLCPWKIGNIVAAALVLLHIEHNRTT